VDITGAITFDWQRQNFNANDSFHLIVWNNDFTTRLINDFTIPGNVTTYTLTAAQRALLGPGIGSTLNFDIIGYDLKDSANTAYAGIEITGNYWSDAYQFSLTPEPGTLSLACVAAMGLLRRRR
jgi:hypothetical protein